MSSEECEINGRMCRIQYLDDQSIKTYENEKIKVYRETDSKDKREYLSIFLGSKRKFDERMDQCRWLVDSSKPGIAVIQGPSAKVVIGYHPDDRRQRVFFEDLADSLEKVHAERNVSTRRAPSPVVATRQWTSDDLIHAISRGSRADAEEAAAFLAQSRARVSLSLKAEENQENKPSHANCLELKLRIEHHSNANVGTRTIYVPRNMDLQSLKRQIADETDIPIADQYWFAADRFSIPDEYVFGSDEPVIRPARSRRSTDQSKTPPTIRSGDTLVLYIGQLPQLK